MLCKLRIWKYSYPSKYCSSAGLARFFLHSLTKDLRNLKHFIIKGISYHTYMGMIYQFNKTSYYLQFGIINFNFNTIANKIAQKKPKLNTIFGKFGMVYGILVVLVLPEETFGSICVSSIIPYSRLWNTFGFLKDYQSPWMGVSSKFQRT